MRPLSGCSIGSEEGTDIGIPSRACLRPLCSVPLRILSGVVYDAEQIIQFAGSQVDLLMIIEVVPPLHFSQEVLLQLWLDDGRDLEEEVELFDEALAEGEIGTGPVVADDVVQTTVGGRGQ